LANISTLQVQICMVAMEAAMASICKQGSRSRQILAYSYLITRHGLQWSHRRDQGDSRKGRTKLLARSTLARRKVPQATPTSFITGVVVHIGNIFGLCQLLARRNPEKRGLASCKAARTTVGALGYTVRQWRCHRWTQR
jgi:hypothetical protein